MTAFSGENNIKKDISKFAMKILTGINCPG
jgi:hypothetical protein